MRPPLNKSIAKFRLEILILAVFSFCTLAMNSAPLETTKTLAVKIIFDTDISGDCDDTGALAVLHKLADLGEAEILACLVNGLDKDKAAAAAVSAINTYYGRPHIPVGTYKGSHALITGSHYTAKLRDSFPHSAHPDDQMPAATDIYRTALASAPDDSVIVISVGFLINLRGLLESKPDDSSPLTGVDLVRKKVKQLVLMGGAYPQSDPIKGEYNLAFGGVGPDSQFVIENWPTRILFTGFELGGEIITGKGLISTPATNPVREAYRLHGSTQGRSSWDLTAVLAAVRGPHPLWDVSPEGYCKVAANGSNQWSATPNRGHSYLINKVSADKVANQLDALLDLPSSK